jgi:dipeptide/tripeptide permease
MARVTQRLGARTAMRTGIAISAIGCLAIAGLARSYWQLVAALVASARSWGLVDTAAAGAFAAAIRRGGRGVAFGIKEASVPVASMVAGVSVPVAAAWLGWRGAFAAVALLFPVAWFLVPRATALRPSPLAADVGPTVATSRPPHRREGGQPGPWARSVGWRSGSRRGRGSQRRRDPARPDRELGDSRRRPPGSCSPSPASRASSSVWSPGGRRTGREPPERLGRGRAGGRCARGGHAGVSGPPAVVVAGAVLTLGAGWGWTGLAFLAAVRLAPSAPARAAGIVLTGLAIGGAVGPVAFASVGARAGPRRPWGLATAGFVAGAIITAAAGRRATHR